MKHSVFPGSRSGTVKIPASKSMAHRLLIAAALGKDSKILHFDGFSNDIGATIVCLRALGAEITERHAGRNGFGRGMFAVLRRKRLNTAVPAPDRWRPWRERGVSHGGTIAGAASGAATDDPLRTRYENRKNGRSARLQREIVR